MAFKILPIFGRNQEEETLKSIAEQLKLLDKANKIFRDCVRFWLDDDYDKTFEKAEEIIKIEKKADTLTHKITEDLFGGAFLPSTRSNLHELIEEIDDVIDGLMHSSQLFRYMEDKKFPEELKGKFWKLGDSARISVEKFLLVMNDLLESNDDILIHIKEAKDLEHECDILKQDIYELIYFGKKDILMNPLLPKIADLISGIADSVELANKKVMVLKLLRQA